MEKFRTQHASELGSASRSVDQTIESIGINIQWMEDNYKSIASWLSDHIAPSVTGDSSSTASPEL
jgi:hypothetical protein